MQRLRLAQRRIKPKPPSAHIGCAIVMLMKGPAFVADAYVMEEPTDDV
jgi:phosphotransacetylase